MLASRPQLTVVKKRSRRGVRRYVGEPSSVDGYEKLLRRGVRHCFGEPSSVDGKEKNLHGGGFDGVSASHPQLMNVKKAFKKGDPTTCRRAILS